MHNLKDTKYLPAFRSKSYSGKAFQVGAGVTVQEIYRAADAQDVTVLGGICEVSHSASLAILEANGFSVSRVRGRLRSRLVINSPIETRN